MAEDEVKGAKPGAAAAPAKRGPEPPNITAVHEDLVEKLKFLNYEQGFCRVREFKPLSRVFFAVPGKTQEQFPYFAGLVVWLLKEMQHDFLEWTEFEEPSAISTTILEQLKKLGFQVDFPASKLRPGYGDAIVLSLNFLVDKLLAQRRFKTGQAVYQSSEFTEEAVADDDAEIVDTEIKDELDEEPDVETSFGGAKPDEKEEEKLEIKGIMESKDDPAVWKLELERVGPLLKVKTDGALAAKEWRTHLDQSIKHEQLLFAQFPESKGSLDKIAIQLKADVERIQAKERHINKEFEHLGGEFRTNQKKLDEIQEIYNKLSASVAELTNELQSKSEQVEQIKSQMMERNNAMTDSSPLKKITAALAELRKEVSNMELRIGVLGQTLLQSKLKHHHNQQHAASAAGSRKAADGPIAIPAANAGEEEEEEEAEPTKIDDDD